MTLYTTATAYAAVRILIRSGHPTVIPIDELRAAERELILLLTTPELVTNLEFRIADAASEYNSRLQAAKYAAVCP